MSARKTAATKQEFDDDESDYDSSNEEMEDSRPARKTGSGIKTGSKPRVSGFQSARQSRTPKSSARESQMPTRPSQITKRFTTQESEVYMMGVHRGRTKNSFCCCFTRVFLMFAGLAGVIIFSVIFALHFYEKDKVTRKVQASLNMSSPYLWIGSLVLCGLLIVIHVLLMVGAMAENGCLICAFVYCDTTLTCLFLLAVGFLIAVLLGAFSGVYKKFCKHQHKNEKMYSKRHFLIKKCVKRLRKKEGLEKVVVVLSVAVLLPAIALWLILTPAACSYVNALMEDL